MKQPKKLTAKQKARNARHSAKFKRGKPRMVGHKNGVELWRRSQLETTEQMLRRLGVPEAELRAGIPDYVKIAARQPTDHLEYEVDLADASVVSDFDHPDAPDILFYRCGDTGDLHFAHIANPKFSLGIIEPAEKFIHRPDAEKRQYVESGAWIVKTQRPIDARNLPEGEFGFRPYWVECKGLPEAMRFCITNWTESVTGAVELHKAVRYVQDGIAEKEITQAWKNMNNPTVH